MLTCRYDIPSLPLQGEIETKAVLKLTVRARAALSELRGEAKSIPNQSILLDTLILQEAKESSEVENIVTTQDELFRASLVQERSLSGPLKEVIRYREAMDLGLRRLRDTDGLLPARTLTDLFRLLKDRQDGYRRAPGTSLKNDQTGEVIYVPPQHPDAIANHMSDLERYINADDTDDLDPLVRMAVIHHQFESIHPFPDGNGRVGRMLNVLYLVKVGLLDTPILYLSRYVNANKADYYRSLQDVRDGGAWEPWIVFMLTAVEDTSHLTLRLVRDIKRQMAEVKVRMRRELPKVYSQDLLNNLFRHPYTRIDHVMDDLGVSRPTATSYLDQLSAADFVDKVKVGRANYYVNAPLLGLFSEVSP